MPKPEITAPDNSRLWLKNAGEFFAHNSQHAMIETLLLKAYELGFMDGKLAMAKELVIKVNKP